MGFNLDTIGRFRLGPRFDDLGEFDGGMAAATLDGRAGYILQEGEWLIQLGFDKCYRFAGDLAIVKIGETYKYVSRNGATIWASKPYAMAHAPPYRQ